ncbi:hypothetical protein ABT369_56565 [Dactylosporangium sp. NPDC000244]|uniref:hypothetical protein n=1 Tax=Dactylosporangium sp. NPDC000244 TaxID=3154365 RepID=UPI00331EF552
MKTRRGERPVYLGDAHTDRLLAAIVVLGQEIGVLQRRVAVLEGRDPGEDSVALSRVVEELTKESR